MAVHKLRDGDQDADALDNDVLDEAKAKEAQVGGVAADRLRSLIERIERLEEERKALGSDIKDIMPRRSPPGST